EIQIAEAAPALALRSEPRGISREVGPASRLSDGGAELRAGALAPRKEDGSRARRPPHAPRREVAHLPRGGAFPLHRDAHRTRLFCDSRFRRPAAACGGIIR